MARWRYRINGTLKRLRNAAGERVRYLLSCCGSTPIDKVTTCDDCKTDDNPAGEIPKYFQVEITGMSEPTGGATCEYNGCGSYNRTYLLTSTKYCYANNQATEQYHNQNWAPEEGKIDHCTGNALPNGRRWVSGPKPCGYNSYQNPIMYSICKINHRPGDGSVHWPTNAYYRSGAERPAELTTNGTRLQMETHCDCGSSGGVPVGHSTNRQSTAKHFWSIDDGDTVTDPMQWNGRTLTHEITIVASDGPPGTAAPLNPDGSSQNDIVNVLGQALDDPDDHHLNGLYQPCYTHIYDTPGDMAMGFHNTAGTKSGEGPGFADFDHATDGIRCWYGLVGGSGLGCCDADGSTLRITALPDENLLPACVEPE